MLDQIDLKRKASKEDYKRAMERIELEWPVLQRELRERGIPLAVVFEGWGASGKGTLINELILPLDPRGFKVFSTLAPTQEEAYRPFLWRFWKRMPAAGRIAIFDRSWYSGIINGFVDRSIGAKERDRALRDICSFERQHVEEGAVILKFFLHISKKEQKRRFDKLRKKEETAWRVTGEDLKRHRLYAKYAESIEYAIAATSCPEAPWYIVEAEDRRFAVLKVYDAVIRAARRALKNAGAAKKKSAGKADGSETDFGNSVLGAVDHSKTLERADYRKRLESGQRRIRELEHKLYMKRRAAVIVYEGWDAAGKGGNIRRLTRNMDPRGYEVVPVAAPSEQEKAHHYLWRFWQEMPKAGHITIFDRSWYGRVLVERVEGFCSEAAWRRAYRQINEMERHISDFGAIIIKFWLDIHPDEQLRRFNDRKTSTYKRWKITEEDWRNRAKYADYLKAAEEMLVRTSTPYAPWTIVESDCKLFARIKVIETVIRVLEEHIES